MHSPTRSGTSHPNLDHGYVISKRWPLMYSELLVWSFQDKWRQTPTADPTRKANERNHLRFIWFFHHCLSFFGWIFLFLLFPFHEPLYHHQYRLIAMGAAESSMFNSLEKNSNCKFMALQSRLPPALFCLPWVKFLLLTELFSQSPDRSLWGWKRDLWSLTRTVLDRSTKTSFFRSLKSRIILWHIEW